MMPNTQRKSSQRRPPPFLFQGPPSRNTSNLSLPSALVSGAQGHGRASNGSQTPAQPPLSRHVSSSRVPTTDAQRLPPTFARTSESRRESERGGEDAIWGKMQHTLDEVDLSATNRAHVFGTNHSKALEELRNKQLALAQAWARSETEEVSEIANLEGDEAALGKAGGSDPAAHVEPSGDEEGSQKAIDEQTEKDILLARKRREANDRYFDRVNNSVLDVVSKLEEVADAMQAVERESKEVWSRQDNLASSGRSNG